MNKRLYRSQQNKIVAGVCGGFAEYFDVDPVLIRLLFVVLLVFHGTGILAYLCCIVIIPKRQYTDEYLEELRNQDTNEVIEEIVEQKKARDNSFKKLFAYLLIILGAALFVDNLVPFFRFSYIAPVIMILAGLWLLLNGAKKERNLL